MEKFECIKCKENEVKGFTICASCIRKIIEESKEIKREIFLATDAYHLLLNVSSKTPNICAVNRETKDYYLGSWLTGPGLMSVVFPKETTRKAISEEEAKEFAGYYGLRGVYEKISEEALLGTVDYTEIHLEIADEPIEFKINEYIALKFENKETVIYVGGKKFIQCKYLLLDIPVEETEGAEEVGKIKSIDEAAETLDRKAEHVEVIPPKTEFWGHCSNLQAWAENNYDTRLLHRNIAFPLLKKLTEAKDPQAKKIFKEEIATRLEEGNENVALFLINEGYLSYFNKEEMEVIVRKLFEIENKKLIFDIIELLREQAWQNFLERDQTKSDLHYVVEYVKSMREQAWQKLLELGLTNDDLYYIIRHVEALREQARELLKNR